MGIKNRTEINKENGSCYYGNRDPFVSRRIVRRIATVCGRRNCASSQPWNRGLSSFYAVPRVADSFVRSSNNFQLSKVRYSTRRETRPRARVKAIIVIARIVNRKKKKKEEERKRRKERKNNRELASGTVFLQHGVRLIFSTVTLLLLTFPGRILAFSTDVPLCNWFGRQCFLSPTI